MNRRTLLSTTIVGTSALSGCLSKLPWSDANTPLPKTPTGSWTQYGANGANTFTTNLSAPARGNLAWEADARWQPVVSDGTVYVTNFDPSRDGSVLALDAQDGTEQWRTTLNAEGENGIVMVDDRCIVAYGTNLVALDPQSGEQIWTQTTSGLGGYELLVADESTGTVLVASENGIEAFAAQNGEQRWTTETSGQTFHSPAIYDGQVFVVETVDEATSLVGRSLEDGSKRWQSKITFELDSADPVATQQGVLVFDGRSLVIHDKNSGKRRREIFSFDEDEGLTPRTIAADDGTVFIASWSDALAVDIETGTEKWHRDTQKAHSGICVGSETVVLSLDDPEFSPGEKTISALDRESGEMRWYYDLDFNHSTPILRALVDGAVFYSRGDSLFVLGDVDE